MEIAEIFNQYQEILDNEQELREEIRVVVKEIDQSAREIQITLQQIHKPDATQQIESLCAKAESHFVKVKEQYAALALKVPPRQFYRFNDHWRWLNYKLTHLATLMIYLKEERLATWSDVAALLGVCTQEKEGFHLDLEDYLIGLLQLVNELARFTVNSVTAGDYKRPMQVAKFVSDLDGGFRLLNLKNDNLRKRFDALKYDVKKIEEVVYDLSIRGLTTQKENPTS